LVEDADLYKGFNIDRFLAMRNCIYGAVREADLSNSWFHRSFSVTPTTCFDQIEVLVDKDLNRYMGREFYVGTAIMHSDNGIVPGSGTPRDVDYCMDVVREIYAKTYKAGNHPSLEFFETLFRSQLKVAGKGARFQMAHGDVSATISYTEQVGKKESFASLVTFKIVERR
jgi:hypothetical protein